MAEAAPAKPWAADFPKVTQFSTFTKMKQDKEYSAAKGGDSKAAARLIRNIMGEGAQKETSQQKKIRALMEKHPDATLLPVHAEEKAGRNEIPAMLAEYIAEKTGLEIDVDIIQTEKVGRIGSNAWYRMANRAKFGGGVQQGRKYILVDDVVARGGTFSDLRYYVENHGGEAVNMMSVGAGKFSTNIALSEKTRLALEERFGVKSLRNFLKK
ncbi:MAG: phosphoribosyltransferase [Synergistaceae bacterium]|jgi:hypothetical protein|nr:phosphoribosyltransferase [Synergistaceae bacterium]